MTPCIFCQIVAGKAPAQIVYRNDDLIAFHDIAPQAPTHLLVVPTRHIASMDDLQPEGVDLIGQMLMAATKVAHTQGLQAGYRLVINTGKLGGQTVRHLHVHILGGRQMTWPPG